MAGTKRSADFDKPAKLMVTVQNLIKDDPRSLPELYRDCGVPFYWLKKFIDGGYQNPSVNRVEYLYTFLSGKELDL